MTSPSWIRALAIAYVTSSSVAAADIPVASWPDEDSEPSPAASGTGSAQPAPLPTSTPQVVSGTGQPAPVPTSPAPVLDANHPTGLSPTSRPINETPSALVPTAVAPATGVSTLRVLAKAAGSQVLVFPYREDEDYLDEAALLRCQASCSVDLPHGRYSLRVVTADGEVSYVDLSLNMARWVSVTPAPQVTRDLGFTMGVVGAVATVLGGAMLAGAICDSCSKVARNIVGGLSLGIGIPMLAVGGSMYIAYRKASIEDQVLTQTESGSRAAPVGSRARASNGWIGAGFRF